MDNSKEQIEQEFLNPLDMLKEGGIPKTYLYSSQTDIDHLICPICFNILWKPVACAQDKCFQSFCDACITRWINTSNQQTTINYQEPSILRQQSLYHSVNNSSNLQDNNVNDSSSSAQSEEFNDSQEQEWVQLDDFLNDRNSRMKASESAAKCPKCKRPFKKTSIPIVHNLLSTVQFNCIYQGCTFKPNYDQFLKHILNCPFRRINCSGCQKVFLQNEIAQHQEKCDLVIISCGFCQISQQRKIMNQEHSKDICIDYQFKNKDKQISILQQQIEELKVKYQELEFKVEKISKGEFERLTIYNFRTSFTSNYQFQGILNNQEVKLIRYSYNQLKQKNDFLHFYINRKIKTQSIIGLEWKMKIMTLQGNLLLGICSSLNHNSIDFIINRHGEIKKKEWNENKYRHLRKIQFTFNEGDELIFQFLPFAQSLRIINETQQLVCRFESQEIIEMGECFFNFFSLETQGDTLVFF